MVGRRRVGAHAAPRHALGRTPLRGASSVRGMAVVVAGGIGALTAAVLLSGSPAGAEAGSTTATLTLTGVRDSNCDVSTGGTTVYVKPGGDITFQADLAGITIKVPPLGLPLNLGTAGIASFNDKLIIDGDKKHYHLVSDTKKFVWHNVSGGTHQIQWSANSVQLLSGLTIPLNADTVLPSSLPVGGQLNWVGSAKAASSTKCGISIEVPGGGVTVGPIHASIPPITTLPTIPASIPNVPIGGGGGGGGGGGSSSHHPGSGGHSSSPGGGSHLSGEPTPIPELVVPNAGSGGDSAFGGGGGLGGLGAIPDVGHLGAIAPGAVTSTAAPAPRSGASSSAAKPVNLATDSTDGGLGGAQLPVLLAIVAIIALSLVTATYARMYLLRKPPAGPTA